MVSVERELRRSRGETKRRRALADHASGHVSGAGPVPAHMGKVARFRVVIYLSAARNSDIAEEREQCTGYATAFGWEIADVVEDRVGLLPPEGRAGLTRTLALIEEKKAGALLTPCRSMISSVPQEYDEVAREIEKRGGFLHVMNDQPRCDTWEESPCE